MGREFSNSLSRAIIYSVSAKHYTVFLLNITHGVIGFVML